MSLEMKIINNSNKIKKKYKNNHKNESYANILIHTSIFKDHMTQGQRALTRAVNLNKRKSP